MCQNKTVLKSNFDKIQSTLKVMQYNILIILFICFCSTSLSSQKLVTNEISKRVYTTKKLVEVPIIDGKISEIA